jgi:hypothetical protein
MISWAILGIFFALILPGLLISLLAIRHSSLKAIDHFILAIPISAVFNFFLVFLLVQLGAYSTDLLRGLCLFFLASLFIVLFSTAGQISSVWNSQVIFKTIQGQAVIIALGLAGFLPLFYVWLTVQSRGFEHWDAVATWSRWAVNWYDQSPIPSWGYPPTVPILYSLVYKMAGATHLQIYAKQVANFYPFYAVLCLWRSASLVKQSRQIIMIAALIFLFLLARTNKDVTFIFSGYADPFMAAFAAYFFYLFIFLMNLKRSKSDLLRRYQFLTMIAVSVAVPALIKQNGLFLIAFSCVFMLGYVAVYRQISWTRLIYFGFILSSVATSWYIYSFFKYHDYYRAEELLNPQIFLRFYEALNMTIKRLSVMLVFVWAYANYKNKFIRQLTLYFVMPLWLLWAYLVSYDFRTAIYLLPILSYQIAVGLHVLYVDLKQYFEVKNKNYLVYISHRQVLIGCTGAVCIILVVLPIFFKDQKLLEVDTNVRFRFHDFGFNRTINTLMSQSSQAQKILSCDQMFANLPEAHLKFVPIGDCENEYKIWLDRKDVKYLIYWSSFSPRDPELVRQFARDAHISFKETPMGDHYILFEKL